ncbi:chaplin family protein [Planomonospora corallina]|uniref:Chaplin family protein n=1 Tax=Planomonospora corallina TaxID=1806052 RepID=A0ABV8HZ74_9ACTN
MRTWVKRTSPAALLALGALSLGSGTAYADDTSGNGSILGGNQLSIPITLPIDISGNAVSVIGKSAAHSEGGASVQQSGQGGAGGNRTSGDGSILGGNQVVAPITAPVNVCGNAVAVIGGAKAGCKGGASVKQSGQGGAGGNRTSGNGSILGGNQVVAPITAPVNVCGNSVGAVLGGAFAGCKGGAEVTDGGKKPGHAYHNGHGGGSGAGGNRTSGNGSILGGNQVVAPITAPVNVCGNSVGAVLGGAFAGCKGGASVKQSGKGGAGGNRTSGNGSILSGNQVVAPITAVVNVCGNAVAVLGDAAAGCLGGANVGGPDHGKGHHKPGKPHGKHSAGLLPALPVVPSLNNGQGADRQSAAPAAAGVPGLSEAPGRPGSSLPSTADLTKAVPVGDIGLMSAARPAGVTGMTSGSLLALVLGGMAAASATLFSLTRRVRTGRHHG